MSFVNLLLDLAGLLLWVNWRSAKFDPIARSTPATLIGTVRSAEPRRATRWHFPLVLSALLVLRAGLYWHIGPLVDWTPSLNLGVISVSFRSDYFARALLFSVLSFVAALAVFYLWLLLFSIINSSKSIDDPVQRLVRLHLGWFDRWPWPLKLVLPLLVTALLWLGIDPVLSRLDILPPSASFLHRLEQAATLGLGVYFLWKYVIVGVLILFLLNSYVYLGNHPIWSFLSLSGRNLLAPVRRLPLRIGKLDFAPIIAIALAVEIASILESRLTHLYTLLPL